MGEITDALRANLRELAQSDARLLRELDTLIPGGPASGESLPTARPAAQLDDGLERLSLQDLKDLCKQKRLKGFSKLRKDELIALLRGRPSSSPVALPVAAPALPAEDLVSNGQLRALERRLERMEGLLQRIASQLGVS